MPTRMLLLYQVRIEYFSGRARCTEPRHRGTKSQRYRIEISTASFPSSVPLCLCGCLTRLVAADSLAVNRRHLLLGVTRPRHILGRKRCVEPGHLLAAERHGHCADVVLEVCSFLGTGD